MKVTDKNYSMDKGLVGKLDLMIDRMTGNKKFDNLVLIDGDEGYGKSNMAAGIAYYVHYQTGRELTLEKNMFFDLEKLINFALNTEEQIIIWDEGALGGLASEWWNKNQKKFLKLLMVARKKRHFFIICIPKFFKLNEYFVVDRSIGMIHVYARNETKIGRFVYYNKKAKEKLYYDWKKKRVRNYRKYKTLWGSFSEVLPIVFNEKDYENMKDKAILSIDEVEEKTNPRALRKEMGMKFIRNILQSKLKMTNVAIAEALSVPKTTIADWVREIKAERKTADDNNTSREGSEKILAPQYG